MNQNDLTGQRFGKLTVLHRDEDKPKGKHLHAFYICACDCETIKSVRSSFLRQGKTYSCGCLRGNRGLHSENNLWDIGAEL